MHAHLGVGRRSVCVFLLSGGTSIYFLPGGLVSSNIPHMAHILQTAVSENVGQAPYSLLRTILLVKATGATHVGSLQGQDLRPNVVVLLQIINHNN